MIPNLLIKLSRFLTEKKAFFFAFLILMGMFLIYGVGRLRISESILDSLPKSSAFTSFQQRISESRLDSRVFFSLDVPPGTDWNQLYDTVGVFGQQLRTISGDGLTHIREFRESSAGGVMQFVVEHLPELIDSSYFAYIATQTSEQAIAAAVAEGRSRLASPEGIWTKELILGDPLKLSYPLFADLQAGTGSTGTRIENDMVLLNEGRQVLITAQTSFPPGDSKRGGLLYAALEQFKHDWNRTHPDTPLHYFGGFALAASNAAQIKSDSFTTMAIALIVIFGLIWAYYRSFKTSLIILTPALFGGLFALGMLGYVSPSVSGISLATGAVLLGIALDYSIHFVSHYRHTGSVPATLQDIATPLITGSLTTILAYSALFFANSELLSQFGIFAGFALSGALVFTLTGLPVVLAWSMPATKTESNRKPLFAVPPIPKKYGLPVLVGMGLITLILYHFAADVGFDGDPRNIGMQPQSLKEAERLLTPLDPEHDTQLFIFASGSDELHAAQTNTSVYHSLGQLQKDGMVKSFHSAAPFAVPDTMKSVRNERWKLFWQTGDKGAQVTQILAKAAEANGFSADAFSSFTSRLRDFPGSAQRSDRASAAILQDLETDNLVLNTGGSSTYITTVVVAKDRIDDLKSKLGTVPDVQLFHRSEMAESLLAVVKEDFNYILLVSASIVFIALLLFYGRLELALLSFMPMVISWIWILGITVLLDVKFNFVNVVFATFIFGLGDDFSIFMTDGLLQRYRQGRNKLASYTSAISLSGLTVLIGTGALLFATHPALRSIAVVSVPGIVCIVLVSLVFQPLVFGLFVQNRVDNGRTPIGIWTFLKTWFCFLFFVCMCSLAFLVMLVLIVLPMRRKTKKAWLARVMSLLSTAVMYSGTSIRKKTYGKEYLDYRKPAILIANHSSFLDVMIMLMHHPKAVIMVKEWVYKSPLYGWVIRYANYIFIEEGANANAEQARELVNDGYSIIIFPEGTRSGDGRIHRFHKGAFYLAEQLHLAIQPVLIHGAGYVSPKNELIIKNGPVNVGILPRIEPDDMRWGSDFRQRAKSISAYFRSEYEAFRKKMDDTRFMKQRIFNNYIFKGPVLEHYFRVKWELEKKNYEYYDQAIGDRVKILDLGCGYGFLAFYLHYRDESRQIRAIDYDEEKIAIAANSYGKTGNLQFDHADVTQVEFEKQDVIFLNDVLHYLSRSEQSALLAKCVQRLKPGGLLFIRDGVSDEEIAHQKTKITEWLSTKLFYFNKKEREFHFFTRQDIRSLAASNALQLEERTHSKTTSNMLFVLRKPAFTPHSEEL